MNSETPNFIMVVGLPCSGKSHMLNENFSKEYNIHSSDKIRAELLDGENDQSNNSLVFEELHKRIKKDLKNARSCCYDAVNQKSKRRKSFLEKINGIQAKKTCIIVYTPFQECVENDRVRGLTEGRSVGYNIIDKFYKSFSLPTKREGWDEIKIIYNTKQNRTSTEDVMRSLLRIEQDNPHHTLTIGNHCLKCAENIIKDDGFCELNSLDKEVIFYTALLHDIGKKHTKEFKNHKGEETDVAHYFCHESVGCYDSLFIDCIEHLPDDSRMEIADLIQLHMRLYSDTEKNSYKTKLRAQVGERTFNFLEMLNTADKNAK